ncbi:MAG: DNA-binding transcriptional regulator [Bacteroidota bacterium]
MKKIILLVETSREFGRQLICGIARYSRINGPWSFYREPTGLRSSIPQLTNWGADGIIMRNSLIKKELLDLKLPTILVLHDITRPDYLPAVITDSKAIAKLASEHLISKGLKNFGFCGFDNYEWSNARKFHFKKYIEEAGHNMFIYDQPSKNKILNWKNEQVKVLNWLRFLPKPIGIMTCNDDRGQHILEVCKLIGLKVPEDVSVVGVDNDPMICEVGDPPLTSIALNVEPAGYSTAQLLDELMHGKEMCGQEILVTATHLVQRQSTDILAVNDTEVAKAIRFIKQNAKNKLLVNDVVKNTYLNRRSLELRFRKTIHRSIQQEIRHVRVEWISKLLLETDLPVSEITSLFNFTDVEHISRYFKKEKGMGLKEFRKLHRPF